MTYTLTIKPVAPAFLRPQRFVLKVEGERIVDVEYRPDTGDEVPFSRLERMRFSEIVATAARLCPDGGISHALALCHAIEALVETPAPPCAERLRLAAAELERAASHLTTLAALFRILSLGSLAQSCAADATAIRRSLSTLTGGDPAAWLRPGGLEREPDATTWKALAEVEAILARLFPLAERTVARPMLLARTVEVGVISATAATQYGLAGPLARAAGLSADVRRDAPYGAYAELMPELALQEGGDVHARIAVLFLETLEALRLVQRVAQERQEGPVRVRLPETLPVGAASAVVEAPRGPLRYYVASDGGQISAIRVQSAPQLDRLLARTVLVNAALDDAALIVVSTDPCDTCPAQPQV
ncbi:MAG: hypothetical protein N2378_09255 [Chloroflexaceae bacterium]|nr:hypothetical protein [Chloroflexaceae bacterium]